MHPLLASVLLAGVLLDGPPPAASGNPVSAAAPTTPAPGGERPWTISFVFDAAHTLGTDLSDAPGDVSVSRTSGDLTVAIPIEQRGRLSLHLDTELSLYDFGGATAFAAGASEPWDNTIEQSLRGIFAYQQTDTLGWFVGGGIGSAREWGADFDRSVTAGALGGISYRFGETLTGSLGLLVATQLEDDALVIPLPGIEWAFAPRWRLSTMNKPGLGIFYSPQEDLTLSLEAEYQLRRFRLDRDGASPEGIGEDRRVPISVNLDWKATEHTSLSLRAGIEGWQRYRLEDPDGNRLSSIEADAALFFGLGVSVAF